MDPITEVLYNTTTINHVMLLDQVPPGSLLLKQMPLITCSFSSTIINVPRKKVPVLMMTDSKVLFDVTTRVRLTTEARLIVDIAAV